MGRPGAKQDDEVVGLDIHIVMIPSPAGPVPTPMPMPFVGKLKTCNDPTDAPSGVVLATGTVLIG